MEPVKVHVPTMWEFYREILSDLPGLLWGAVQSIEGAVAVLLFIVWIISQAAGRRAMKMEWIKSRWMLLPILLLFSWSLLRSNYNQFIALQQQGTAAIRAVEAERDALSSQLTELVALLDSPALDAKSALIPETGTKVRVTPFEKRVLIEMMFRVENTGPVPIQVFAGEFEGAPLMTTAVRPKQMWLGIGQHDFMRVKVFVDPSLFAEEFRQTPEEMAAGIADGTRQLTLAFPFNFFSAIKPDAAHRLFVKYRLNVDRLELVERRPVRLNLTSFECKEGADAEEATPLYDDIEAEKLFECFTGDEIVDPPLIVTPQLSEPGTPEAPSQ